MRVIRLPRRAAPFLPVVFVIAAIVCVVTPAYACSCVGTMSGWQPCQERWRSDAVFSGTVLGIEPYKPAGTDGREVVSNLRRVRILVKEAFAGVSVGEVEVLTGTGGGDCGYNFEVGRQYVVYANKASSGSLGTGICSRTRALEDATDDLAYMRSLGDAKATAGRIFGMIVREPVTNTSVPPAQRPPYAGARVTVEGNGARHETTTDATGRYEVRVPAGDYRVSAAVSAGMYLAGPSLNVTLADARGCAAADFYARYDGRVSTRVLDEAGKPIPFLWLELVSADSSSSGGASARSNSDGEVDLRQIPPGEYLLGFNTRLRLDRGAVPDVRGVFFPGTLNRREARTIVVEPGGTVTLDNFIVPDTIRIVTLTGTVVDVDGRPIASASVYLKADVANARSIGDAVKTDADGRFTVVAVAGARYRILAEASAVNGYRSAEVGGVMASVDTQPIVLKLVGR